MEADSRLERVFVGRGLTQISSVNSYSQMQSLDLHNEYYFDCQFEDNREIFAVNDAKSAIVIKRTISNQFADVVKARRERAQR